MLQPHYAIYIYSHIYIYKDIYIYIYMYIRNGRLLRIGFGYPQLEFGTYTIHIYIDIDRYTQYIHSIFDTCIHLCNSCITYLIYTHTYITYDVHHYHYYVYYCISILVLVSIVVTIVTIICFCIFKYILISSSIYAIYVSFFIHSICLLRITVLPTYTRGSFKHQRCFFGPSTAVQDLDPEEKRRREEEDKKREAARLAKDFGRGGGWGTRKVWEAFRRAAGRQMM